MAMQVTEGLWDTTFNLCSGTFTMLTTPTLLGIMLNALMWIALTLLIIALICASERESRGPTFIWFDNSSSYSTSSDGSAFFLMGYLVGALLSVGYMAIATLLTPVAIAVDLMANTCGFFFSGMTTGAARLDRFQAYPVHREEGVRAPGRHSVFSQPPPRCQAAPLPSTISNAPLAHPVTSSSDPMTDNAPEEFVCPINLTLMDRPMIVRTHDTMGSYIHVMDESAVTQWRRTSCSNTNPLNRLDIDSIELDTDLQRQIKEYTERYSPQGVSVAQVPQPSCYAPSAPSMSAMR